MTWGDGRVMMSDTQPTTAGATANAGCAVCYGTGWTSQGARCMCVALAVAPTMAAPAVERAEAGTVSVGLICEIIEGAKKDAWREAIEAALERIVAAIDALAPADAPPQPRA